MDSAYTDIMSLGGTSRSPDPVCTAKNSPLVLLGVAAQQQQQQQQQQPLESWADGISTSAFDSSNLTLSSQLSELRAALEKAHTRIAKLEQQATSQIPVGATPPAAAMEVDNRQDLLGSCHAPTAEEWEVGRPEQERQRVLQNQQRQQQQDRAAKRMDRQFDALEQRQQKQQQQQPQQKPP
ncbi:hypothetical protein BJV82DRAFT_676430 [Fennellomyces sp. T-0311]|nr:hypothetical protein BJV82DRAFT_676430 [Fennellomyces sp. T-0311]